jgi:RHS repeat-associated protein
MTSITGSPPTASGVTFAHSYNKTNQRIGQTVTDNSWINYPAATPSTASYTADSLNRYTAVGAVSPTYDGNSNLTSDGTFTFGYDAENRLTSAVGAGNTAGYTYDAQGRRKTKTVNGTTTVFVTDAANREVLEYDGASGAIQRWYAYGLGSNDVLNQTNVVAGTRAALIPDIQGSVIASLDSSSGTLSKIGYLPYGKSASVAAPFGYTGQRIDTETNGLYYYRARQLSPMLGRFLQADPIGAQGGVNLYAYVNNDPLNLIDPYGLSPDNPQGGGGSGTQLTAGVAVLAPGFQGAGSLAVGGGFASAAVATGGALAVLCVALCPSPIGQDLPIVNNQQGPKEILTPGGVPIGTPNGNDETTRNLPGGQQAAEDLYGQLSQGGTPANSPTYPGSAVTLPSGGFVGIRPGSASTSGVPAIDINIPGIDIGKIHFPQ